MLVSRIMAVTAAAAAIAPAYSATASYDMNESRQVRIQTGDLDLATIAGRHALRQRVNHAVSKVCDLNEVPDNFDNARCRQLASTGAKAQVADALARSTQFAQAPAPASVTTASGS